MTDRPGRRGGRKADETTSTPRVPPHNLNAEESLLGAMLLNREAVEAAFEVGVVPEDFYRPGHGHVYAAIAQLARSDQAVDPVTIAAELDRAGVLEAVTVTDRTGQEVKGPGALVALQSLAPATRAYNATRYANIVTEHARARRMIGLASEIVEGLYGLQVPNGALDHLNQLAVQAKRSGQPRIDVTWGEPADPPRPQPVLIRGFLRLGELAVAAAPRGIGKTFFTYNMAKLLAEGQGKLMGTLEVERPARVLLCQGELEPWQSHSRWQMLGGKPKNVAETWDPWRIRVQRRRRPAGNGGWDEWSDATVDPGLEEAIVDDGVEVLVIDPWRTYFSGSENSNDEAELALAALTAMSRRTGIGIVIIHHITGKTDPARVIEPEDLWRGASRLPDWASTRVTILPHYTAKEAEKAGLSRAIARRHVDVHFLRRSEPTDDFCAVLNVESGWWERWEGATPGAGAGRGSASETGAGAPQLPDVAEHYLWLVDACARSGGVWHSVKEASFAVGKGTGATERLLLMAVRHGLLERYHISGSRYGYRLPSRAPTKLNLDDAPPPPSNEPEGTGQ